MIQVRKRHARAIAPNCGHGRRFTPSTRTHLIQNLRRAPAQLRRHDSGSPVIPALQGAQVQGQNNAYSNRANRSTAHTFHQRRQKRPIAAQGTRRGIFGDERRRIPLSLEHAHQRNGSVDIAHFQHHLRRADRIQRARVDEFAFQFRKRGSAV